MNEETADASAPAAVGVVVLHAAAVQRHGQAVLFLGPSGAGKSTLCQLVQEIAQPVADEVVYVIPGEGGRWVVGNAWNLELDPWLDGAAVCRLGGVPVRAVCRLYQSPAVRVEALHPWQVCFYLAKACLWRQVTAERNRAIFTNLAAIGRAVAGYRLLFDLSTNTVEAVQRIIECSSQ